MASSSILSQLFWSPVMKYDNIWHKVWFSLSTMPFVCGEYELVYFFTDPNIFKTPRHTFDTNSAPRSDKRVCGHSHRGI